MTGYRAITRARKIVFWISTTLFVFTWPFLILYALGIVISPSVKHPVVETGVVRIESFPSGARIFLDGKDTGKTTPAALARLKAGRYRIDLKKPGYRGWQALVTVDIQSVRRLAYAVLVPHVSKARLVRTGTHTAARVSHNTQYLVFTGKTVADLRAYDLKSERFIAHSESLAPYEHDPLLGINLLPWGDEAMLHVRHDGKPRALIVRFGALGIDLQHIVTEPLFGSADFAWSPTLSGAVYFVRKGDLYRMPSWSATSATLLAGKVLSVGIVGNTLYYIDKEGHLGEITPLGRTRVLFTISRATRSRLTSGTRIEYIGGGWGAVLAPGGGLYLLHSHGYSEYPSVRGVAVDKARNRFVVWSERRIGTLSFPGADGGTPPRGDIHWAASPPTDAKISSVTPAAAKSNCLFVSKGSLWVEPILPGVAGHAQRVVSLAPGESYRYSDATGLLLLTDPTIGQMRLIHFITRPLIPRLE